MTATVRWDNPAALHWKHCMSDEVATPDYIHHLKNYLMQVN